MDFGPLLILALLGWCGWKFLRRGGKDKPATAQRAQTGRPPAGPALVPEVLYRWEGQDEFAFNIVGESKYQDTLSRIVGAAGYVPKGALDVLLIPEHDNPYDDSAVRAAIGGETVGYLSRADAQSFRRRMAGKKMPLQVTVCSGKIFGGDHTANGEMKNYGVFLDMKLFGT